jgi:hypothetical protein
MYTRKYHKEDSSVRGRNTRWKDTFAIDDKGGEIYKMQRQRHDSRGSNGHKDAEDKGIVPGGS